MRAVADRVLVDGRRPGGRGSRVECRRWLAPLACARSGSCCSPAAAAAEAALGDAHRDDRGRRARSAATRTSARRSRTASGSRPRTWACRCAAGSSTSRSSPPTTPARRAGRWRTSAARSRSTRSRSSATGPASTPPGRSPTRRTCRSRVVYDGDENLVDPETRPNVFRIAPTNHGMAFRFAEYLVPKKLKVAFLTDDTGYGRAGRASLDQAFSREPRGGRRPDPDPVERDRSRPAGARGAPLGRHGAARLGPAGVDRRGGRRRAQRRLEGADLRVALGARIRSSARSSPAHPQWLDGLTFASSRMTAEAGPGPFQSFQSDYEDVVRRAEGRRASSPNGKEVVQPPDSAMYPYDFVNVLATAINVAQSTDGEKVLARAEPGLDAGRERRPARLQRGQPRGRRRRRRLLRALRRT